MAAQTGTVRYFPTIAADKTSGLVAALSISAALTGRARQGGKGSMVEVPMFESMVAFNMVEHLYGQHFEPPRGTAGYPRVLAPLRRPYQTADGYVCMMPYTDAHWRDFFRSAGRDDLAADRALHRHRGAYAPYRNPLRNHRRTGEGTLHGRLARDLRGPPDSRGARERPRRADR